jgi:hypothetical protein|tara:strand:- start:2036 stop:2527 length:492 start_codon:yes stop_codon:yes gene_type:complete
MAQNQPTSAIAVVPSDSINIPNPGIITSGTNTGGGATLTDAGQDFTTGATNPQGYNITGGDIVINAAGAIGEILSVDSATQLTLVGAGVAAGTYDIYKGNYQYKDGVSPGYSLYVGTGGTLVVLTITDQEVTLLNVGNATWVPLQVQRVMATGTTATDIIALQ